MKDHLGNPMSAEDICKTVAAMLGWGNVPEWHVLERDLRAKLRRLEELSNPINSFSTHNIPIKES